MLVPDTMLMVAYVECEKSFDVGAAADGGVLGRRR